MIDMKRHGVSNPEPDYLMNFDVDRDGELVEKLSSEQDAHFLSSLMRMQ